MFFAFPQDFKEKRFKPGAFNQFFYGDTVLVSRVSLEANRDFGAAVHPYEQISLLLEGEIDLQVGDEIRRMKVGDGVVIPPNTYHRAKTFDVHSVLLEFFGTECKRDFLS
jgi:quercetin dioxygenase-like cupin family protein